MPASEAERRHLGLASGGGERLEVLTDRFDELVLLFADDTADEIGRQGSATKGAPDPRATAAYEAYLKRQKQDFTTNFQLRLLRGPAQSAGAAGAVGRRGRRLPRLRRRQALPAGARGVDPDGAERLGIDQMLGGDTTVLYVADPKAGGVWYSSPSRADAAAGRMPPAATLADALRYRVDDRRREERRPRRRHRASTSRRWSPALRVLPLELMPKLRIQSATVSPAPPAPPTAGPTSPSSRRPRRRTPTRRWSSREPLAKGETVLLRLSYRGDEVLHDAGDKNFVVGRAPSWYPNLGVVLATRPTFELTYRVPAGNEIVSVGRRVETRTEGSESVSVWQTDGRVRVAGFNYGKFKKLEQARRDERHRDRGLHQPRHAGRRARDQRGLSGGGQEIGRSADRRRSVSPSAAGASLGKVNTGRLAESALADGAQRRPPLHHLLRAAAGPARGHHPAVAVELRPVVAVAHLPALPVLPRRHPAASSLGPRRRQGLRRRGRLPRVRPPVVGTPGGLRAPTATSGSRRASPSSRPALAVQHTQGWGAYDRFWRSRRQADRRPRARRAMAQQRGRPDRPGRAGSSTQRSPDGRAGRRSTPRAPTCSTCCA